MQPFITTIMEEEEMGMKEDIQIVLSLTEMQDIQTVMNWIQEEISVHQEIEVK